MDSLAPILAAVSTGNEIGLAAVAATFIGFALISSFVLPSRYPNFPGRGLPAYVAVVVLLFVAMMAAVLVLGKEKSEASAETPPAATSTPAAPATTAPAAAGGAAATGDPVAGKAVFASAGCTGCHTLKAAGSTGTVGPDLDQLKPAEATVVHQVENGGGPMPAFKGQLSPKQIQDVAAFVFTSTH